MKKIPLTNNSKKAKCDDGDYQHLMAHGPWFYDPENGPTRSEKAAQKDPISHSLYMADVVSALQPLSRSRNSRTNEDRIATGNTRKDKGISMVTTKRKRSQPITRRMRAYHEAAHAVTAFHFGWGVDKITLRRSSMTIRGKRETVSGRCAISRPTETMEAIRLQVEPLFSVYPPTMQLRDMKPQHLAQWIEFLEHSATLKREHVIILMAGDLATSLAAGEEVDDEPMEFTVGDIHLALECATCALQNDAQIAELLNKAATKTREPNDIETFSLVKTMREKALCILRLHKNWQAVESIAAGLLRGDELTGDEAKRLYNDVVAELWNAIGETYPDLYDECNRQSNRTHALTCSEW